jgi:hypothetical protein
MLSHAIGEHGIELGLLGAGRAISPSQNELLQRTLELTPLQASESVNALPMRWDEWHELATKDYERAGTAAAAGD